MNRRSHYYLYFIKILEFSSRTGYLIFPFLEFPCLHFMRAQASADTQSHAHNHTSSSLFGSPGRSDWGPGRLSSVWAEVMPKVRKDSPFSEVDLRFAQTPGDKGLLFPEYLKIQISTFTWFPVNVFFQIAVLCCTGSTLWTEPATIFVFTPACWRGGWGGGGGLTCCPAGLSVVLSCYWCISLRICFSSHLKKKHTYFYFFREKIGGGSQRCRVIS